MAQVLPRAGTPRAAFLPPLCPPERAAPPADRLLRAFVLVAAVALAAFAYAGFWPQAHDLWWWIAHDRHAHYMNGLDIAFDLRTGSLGRLFHDLDRLRVWGPLHAVLVALVELVGGPDRRLAVLPSVAGYALTIWCAFLLPRRLLASGGNAAGLLAAFLVAASPAHRAYATDCMYESLGAGLTLACLYLYLVALQDRTRRAAVLLAAALTLLFLHKYNYWLLVLFGLVLGEFARAPRGWLLYARSLCRRDRLPRWMLGELKQPLNYVAAAFAVAALVVVKTGGTTIAWGRWNVSLQTPHNFAHLAYVAFFLRLLLWWRKDGAAWSLGLPPALRTVLAGHGWFVAAWFLLPKRLSFFLWYVSPANHEGNAEASFLNGLPFYLRGLREDYLPLSWGLPLFAAMLVVGVAAVRRMRPGAAALVAFFLVAAYLTCKHPMLKNRHMHSWVAAGWVVGAAGLVYAARRLAAFASGGLRPWAAGLAAASLVALHAPGLLSPGHAQEGGLKAELPSPLRIPETYLPALADAEYPTILGNVPARFLVAWTYIEEYKSLRFASELKNFRAYESDPEPARRWLEAARSDALVLIDVRPGTAFDWPTDETVSLATFHEALAEQSAWVLDRNWELPEGVAITLWRKRAPER